MVLSPTLYLEHGGKDGYSSERLTSETRESTGMSILAITKIFQNIWYLQLLLVTSQSP
jgi:hypothetical protein